MKPIIPMLSLLLLAPLAAADPTTVYKWTDAKGITHYGEAPPDTRAAQRIELDPAPPVSAQDRNFHSIIEQAERLEQQRLERERLRAQAEAARAEAQRQAAQEAAALAAAEFYQQQSTAPERIYTPVPVLPPRRFHPPHPRWRHEPPPPGPIPPHYSGRHPAFAPPQHWLRNHPRLWRKELRAQRDYNQNRDRHR